MRNYKKTDFASLWTFQSKLNKIYLKTAKVVKNLKIVSCTYAMLPKQFSSGRYRWPIIRSNWTFWIILPNSEFWWKFERWAKRFLRNRLIFFSKTITFANEKWSVEKLCIDDWSVSAHMNWNALSLLTTKTPLLGHIFYNFYEPCKTVTHSWSCEIQEHCYTVAFFIAMIIIIQNAGKNPW